MTIGDIPFKTVVQYDQPSDILIRIVVILEKSKQANILAINLESVQGMVLLIL